MAKPEPSIFDITDDERDARREAEAQADIAAGRVVPHDEVREWLKTWGTPEETPAPAHWFKR
jgi:predicted transcriptional regulator